MGDKWLGFARLGRVVSIHPLEFADVLRSLRRSRARRDAFWSLLALKIASPEELAEHAGFSVEHVRGVMIGDMPGFRPEASLVALGLASPRLTRLGPAFASTRKAEVVGAMLVSRAARVEPAPHLNIASMRSL